MGIPGYFSPQKFTAPIMKCNYRYTSDKQVHKQVNTMTAPISPPRDPYYSTHKVFLQNMPTPAATTAEVQDWIILWFTAHHNLQDLAFVEPLVKMIPCTGDDLHYLSSGKLRNILDRIFKYSIHAHLLGATGPVDYKGLLVDDILRGRKIYVSSRSEVLGWG